MYVHKNNYFFVDGSSLIAQIKKLWRSRSIYNKKPLIITEFVRHVMSNLYISYHSGSFKRFVFYFPKGIDADYLGMYISQPIKCTPTVKELGDIEVKECGKKLKGYSNLEKAKIYLGNRFPKALEYFGRAEKGVDTQIVADALKLAAHGHIDRLFLLTNDSDFLPLMTGLKDVGSNISIFHLSKETKIQKDIYREADSYHYVEEKDELNEIFGIKN